MTVESKLTEIGLELPPAAAPAGLYKTALTVGNICYLSGHLPIVSDGSLMTGKVSTEADIETGKQAAQRAGLVMLATLKSHLGSLDRVARVVKLFGMVNASSEFTQHPAIINGCSELFAHVWGEDRGVGARSAMGAGSLPLDVMVEIEAILEITD